MSDTPDSTIPFHIIGPDGSEVRHLKRGQDIPEAQYLKLADSETGTLYGLMYYVDGRQEITAVAKDIWLQAKARFEEIDREAERAHDAIRDSIDELYGHEKNTSQSIKNNDLPPISVFQQINSILNRYINIHDIVFSRSLRNIIPVPFIFRPIQFNDIAKELEILIKELEEMERKMQKTIPPFPLREYVYALKETVSFLREICIRLSKKIQEPSSYRWKAYREDVKKYKALEQKYLAFGPAMNGLFSKMMGIEYQDMESM